MRLLLPRALQLQDSHGLGFGALFSASAAGYTQIVRSLLHAGISPIPPPDGLPETYREEWQAWGSPLIAAAAFGHLEVVKMLLAAGVTLTEYSFQEAAGLICAGTPAIINGHKAVSQYLIDHGLNISQIDTDQGESLLHRICQWENCTVDDVAILVENGLDANQPSGLMETPVSIAIHASEYNFVECCAIIRYLVHHGASVNSSCNSFGWFPLHVAVNNARPEVVQLLLESGADVNGVAPDGMTPLASLMRLGRSMPQAPWHYENVELLLQAGATLGPRQEGRYESLWDAIDSGRTVYIRYLLDAWEDHDLHCLPIYQIWVAAAAMGDVGMLQEMIQNGMAACDRAYQRHDNMHVTALIAAVKSRNEEAVSLVAEHTLRFDEIDHLGRTALHLAIIQGLDTVTRLLLPLTTEVMRSCALTEAVKHLSSAVVSLVLDRMTEVIKAREILCEGKGLIGTGISLFLKIQLLPRLVGAIVDAARLKRVGAVRVLLQYMDLHRLRCGRKCSRISHEFNCIKKCSGLHQAIGNGKHHEKIALLMISHGYGIEARDQDGYTPLMSALQSGRAAIVQALIDADVDLYALTPGGKNAISIAGASDHPELVRLFPAPYLLNYIPRPKSGDHFLRLAARSGHLEFLSMYLPYADPDDMVINAGILTGAAEHGQTTAIELMLDCDFHVDIQDRTGNTALIKAVCHPETVALLLRAGANVNHIGDCAHGTALMYAARRKMPATVKLLAAHPGIEIDAVDKTGRTAFSHAIQQMSPRCAAILRSAGCDVSKADFQGKTPLHYAEEGEDKIPLHSADSDENHTPTHHRPRVNMTRYVYGDLDSLS